MSTIEIIIVFSALMALIALVTIGIDWIGRPLKNRRFIPRIYRFDDEKLPVDAYGHARLDASPPEAVTPAQTWAPPVAYQQPPPVVVATVPEPLTAAAAPPAPALSQPASADPDTDQDADADQDTNADQDAAAQDPDTDQDAADQDTDAGQDTDTDPDTDQDTAADHSAEVADDAQASSTSAFSDLLVPSTSESVPAVDAAAWMASGLVPNQADDTTDAQPLLETESESTSPTRQWTPGMALDAVVDDERPSLATKAERYWKATAAALEESHFDSDAVDRMAAGKAPRRRNPRSGRSETMQLTGLRRGSARSDIRMSWPDSSVDPWAAS